MAYKVKDEFRKNELSLEPGGATVEVTLKNGSSIIYDKIKHVRSYCQKLTMDPNIIKIVVDGKDYWSK